MQAARTGTSRDGHSVAKGVQERRWGHQYSRHKGAHDPEISELATPVRYYSLYHIHSRVEYYDNFSNAYLQLSVHQLFLSH